MNIRDWAHRNREFVIIVAIFSIVILFTFLWTGFKAEPEDGMETHQNQIHAQEDVGDSGQGQSANSDYSFKNLGGYYTEISPKDILNNAFATTSATETVSPILGDEDIFFPVGWFVYFSHLGSVEAEKQKVFFDTEEGAFSPSVEAFISMEEFPQFLQMQSGKKIWIAGKIVNMSLDGLGSFSMKVEHIRFDGHNHLALFPDKENP